ncbi:trafficking kinesin-binding protein 1-like [Pelodytes ibericus]
MLALQLWDLTMLALQLWDLTMLALQLWDLTMLALQLWDLTMLALQLWDLTMLALQLWDLTMLALQLWDLTMLALQLWDLTMLAFQRWDLTMLALQRWDLTMLALQLWDLTMLALQRWDLTMLALQRWNLTMHSASTVGPNNTSASTVGPDNASVSAVGHDNASATTVGPDNASATTVGPDNASATTVGPDNASATTVGPDNASATTGGPDNASSTTVGPDNASATTVGPDNASATTVGPDNASATTVGPDNASATTVGPDKASATTVGPDNASATTVGPDNASATTVGPDKASATTVGPDKASATTVGPDKASATTVGPDKASATTVGPDKASATTVGPDKASPKPVSAPVGASGSLGVDRPGYLFYLPDHGLFQPPVDGSLFLPLTPVKLDPSVPREEAASTTCDNCQPTTNSTSQENAVPRISTVLRDACTITDVCTSGDVPEVEIISLLQEQLPSYTLRADAMFGYEHDDWLHTPLLPPDLPLQLTPEQIEETLKYFLLCSERVGRVTKTYRDIDAVTSLLEEKERDLELAARIGQSLLKQNQELTKKNDFLEEHLEAAKEEIFQLRHEVSMREDLLHLYTNSSEPVSASATPLRRNESSFCLQHNIQLDSLQQKLNSLEDENEKMRSEANHILDATNEYEDQEGSLMLDCVEQFSEASRHVALLAEELARRGEDSVRQQEEISQLLAQIVHLQQKCRNYSTDNEELQQHLAAVKEREQKLKVELHNLQEKLKECQDMLHEAQEELKNQRNRSLPNSTISRYSTLNIFPLDSLAAEIEGTMRKGIDASTELKSYKRVFETVKAANQVVRARSRCPSPQNIPGSRAPSQRPSAAPSRVGTPPLSHYESEGASMILLEEETLLPVQDRETLAIGGKKLGTPGTPGGHDLAAALQRLSSQQDSHSSDSLYEQRERKLRRDGNVSSGFLTPNDSVLSTGTNYSGISEASGSSSFSINSRSHLPERLQIVKPIEGSATLLHWQQLAKPNLGGILDPRPGVLTKDFQELEIDLEDVYNLNDFEEDDMDPISFEALATSTPTKSKNKHNMFRSVNNLPQTQSTYTITTCRMSHPLQDITMVTSSLHNTVLPSCGSFESLSSITLEPQRQPQLTLVPPNYDQASSGRNTPLGLVTLLKEHGISATTGPGNKTPVGNEVHPPAVNVHPSLFELGWGRTFRNLGFGSTVVDTGILNEASNSVQPESSIFSINLVEQLRRLGLNQVVERGIASFQKVTETTKP